MEQITSSSFRHSVKKETNRTGYLERPLSNRQSSSEDFVNSSLSLYQKLASRINEFEDLEFPPLQLPTMQIRPKRRKKCKKQEKIVKEEQPSKVVVKFLSLDKKRDVISGTAIYSAHKEALGPGKYEGVQHGSMPGGIISVLPRFKNTLVDVAEDYLNSKTKRSSDEFIQKNLDLSPCYKEKKLKTLQENAKIREFEEAVHRKTKLSLDESAKEKAQHKYSQKMSKFEWRLRSVEIQSVKKSWSSLISVLGFAYGIKVVIENKIERSKRISKNFRLLSWLCRFVGKIILRLKNYRWKRLTTTIKKHSFHIRKWVNKRTARYKDNINNIIDTALMGDNMTELMRVFMKKMKFIQLQAKSILKIKRARNWALLNLFGKIERQLKNVKKNPKEKTQQLDIEEEIRKFYLYVAREFVGKMKNYKVKLKNYEEYIKKIEGEKSLMISFESVEMPKRPRFTLYTRTHEILSRMKIALGLETSQKVTPMKKSITKSPAFRRQSVYK